MGGLLLCPPYGLLDASGRWRRHYGSAAPSAATVPPDQSNARCHEADKYERVVERQADQISTAAASTQQLNAMSAIATIISRMS
jgi:hypothetical protein